MLQVDATLPRLPERQREPVRRDYRFSLLACLLATGMVGSGAGLLGRAWFAEREAAASTRRLVVALKRDGFQVATQEGRCVLAQGNGQLSARSVEALLHAPRVQTFILEHPGPRPLQLDRLAKTFDVQHSDSHLYFNRQPRQQP
jgi:G:T/U-mismatch repair DNA glycosylase